MTRSPKRFASSGLALAALALAAGGAWARPACAADSADLGALSIEELANVDISSVSKSDQPLSEAPAAVYVITREEILRSGATRLAEILRLAPNLQVAQVTASSNAVSARGFNGTAASKLLVLVDGRSVYSPFFSGVFWDVHDVPPQTIDRIEVISGPGATLWGANAVNGVINIVTRGAAEAQEGVVEGNAGARERRAAAHVSGKLSDSLGLRIYVETASHDDNITAGGDDARDGWRQTQGGFRLDWSRRDDLVTVQGDIYGGAQHQMLGPDQRVSGHNLLGRWTRELAGGSTLQVQAYYDYLERTKAGFFGNYLRTYDLELQHRFTLGRHAVVWGGGYRRTEDRFPIVPGNPSTPLTQFFQPESRDLHFANAFVQDTITLSPADPRGEGRGRPLRRRRTAAERTAVVAGDRDDHAVGGRIAGGARALAAGPRLFPDVRTHPDPRAGPLPAGDAHRLRARLSRTADPADVAVGLGVLQRLRRPADLRGAARAVVPDRHRQRDGG